MDVWKKPEAVTQAVMKKSQKILNKEKTARSLSKEKLPDSICLSMQHTLSPATTTHQTPGFLSTLQSSEAQARVCVHVHAYVRDRQTDRE